MKLYPLDKLNLSLTLLVLVLIGISLKPEQKAPALMNLNPQEINEISISRDGKLRIALLRDQQGWMLTHPDIQRADPKRVRQMLGLLQAPSLLHVHDIDLAAAGLKPARLTFQVDQHQLLIGGPSTPGGQRYVVYKQQVHLIDDHWHHLLTLPASFYQAK